MNILIVYGTTEGQTRKIAEFLKNEAEKLNNKVFLADASISHEDPAGYDAVLIGSSMHMQKYQAAILHYVHKYHHTLNQKHAAFFSVSLTAASDEGESWKELKELTKDFLKDAGWKPCMVEYVAGALRFTEYDYFKKFIMRLIAKKTGHANDTTHDTEYTDWEKLKLFLKNFIDTWGSPPVTVQSDISDQEAVG